MQAWDAAGIARDLSRSRTGIDILFVRYTDPVRRRRRAASAVSSRRTSGSRSAVGRGADWKARRRGTERPKKSKSSRLGSRRMSASPSADTPAGVTSGPSVQPQEKSSGGGSTDVIVEASGVTAIVPPHALIPEQARESTGGGGVDNSFNRTQRSISIGLQPARQQ